MRLTDRSALSSPATGDLIHIVDISDLTDSALGSSKKITLGDLFTINANVATESFTAQTSITVTHNFGNYPVVQVIDNSNDVVIPLSINHTSVNEFTVSFSSSTTGTVIATYGNPASDAGLPDVVSVSTTYTILIDDDIVICTGSSAFTVTLPTAVGATGKRYDVKNNSSAIITLDTTSSQTIDGETSILIYPGSSGAYPNLTVASDGSNWVIL